MTGQQNFITGYVSISESKVCKNNQEVLSGSADFGSFIREIYRYLEISYSPFFKMDNLSKLGFCAAELLLKGMDLQALKPEDTGVVLSNSSSSLDSDMAYFDTINDRSNYFPSPAVFVYTLPNIVIGEICIRHKFKGENMFFVSERFDTELITAYVNNILDSGIVKACVAGWVEFYENRYNAFVYFAQPEKYINNNLGVSAKLHTAEELNNLFNNK